MGIFDNSKDSIFERGTINHTSIHDSAHKRGFHSDTHDHEKIHEASHLGKDKVMHPGSDF